MWAKRLPTYLFFPLSPNIQIRSIERFLHRTGRLLAGRYDDTATGAQTKGQILAATPVAVAASNSLQL